MLERRILKHLSSEKTQVGKPLQPICVSRILHRNLHKPFKVFRNSLLANKGQMNQVHRTATQISPVVQDCRSFKKKKNYFIGEKCLGHSQKYFSEAMLSTICLMYVQTALIFFNVIFISDYEGINNKLSSPLWRELVLTHVQLFRDPMDCGPPSSSVHGTSQARIL